MLKTPRGGYDGKGVLLVREGEHDSGEALEWFGMVTGEGAAAAGDSHLQRDNHFPDGLLAEEAVPFSRELAVMVARSPMGQAAAWVVVETVQTDGICTEVLAPAPGLEDDDAAAITEAALRIAQAIDLTGVMAVELFEVPGEAGGEFGEAIAGGEGPGEAVTGGEGQGADVEVPGEAVANAEVPGQSGANGGARSRYLVNELAMRPHNSGHWTIDGAVTSQFEQHLRAVLDLPLGDPSPRTTRV